jgi:hypothetical protein
MKYKKFIIPAIIIVGALFIFRNKVFARPKPIISDDNDFPLQKGSTGKSVIDLQEALINYDKSLLPRFGADGDFGSETEAAVVKVLGKKIVSSRAEIDKIKKMKK